MSAPSDAQEAPPIEQVELRAVAMPLQGDFATSFGRVRHREMVIVTLRAGGLAGYGEAPVAARPHYSAETTATAMHVLRDWMAPAVVGRALADPAALLERIAFVRGHNMARAALEWAFRDLQAQAAGRSLAATLGASRDRIPVGVSLGMPAGDDVAALVDAVAARVAEGYPRVKLKVARGFLGAPLAAVRAAFPDLRLAADANGAFADASDPELAAADGHDLLFLEQPIRPYDLVEHARLRNRLRAPICLDESVEGPDDLASALALGALDILNLKPGRVGGPTAALTLIGHAAKASVPLWCGGMLETGIGRAACVALAARPELTLEGDLSASERYYADDLVDPPFRLGPGGTLAVPQGPGIGVAIDEAMLARRTTALEVVTAAG